MKGLTVLYNPGYDHAGISTQSVVEKRLWKEHKLTKHDLGREKFLERVWEWKEESVRLLSSRMKFPKPTPPEFLPRRYQEKISNQLRRLGASYDWSRTAFTLSDVRFSILKPSLFSADELIGSRNTAWPSTRPSASFTRRASSTARTGSSTGASR